MTRMPATRTARRLAAVSATATLVALATASPAFAHVEVSAKETRALSKNVVLDFACESESATAGITKAQVFLPEGIKPTDVTYVEGPKGWKLTSDDRSVTVSGSALPAGKDAEFTVSVAQLPDAKSLAFKTLQSYEDERIDRWIELDEGSESPAPVLKLKAAAPGSTAVEASPSTSSAAPTVSATPSAVETPVVEEKAAEKEDDGGSIALPVGLGVAALVIVGGGIWWWQRRGAADGS
ncbi:MULTISPECIES: DUF1775 domain-containing protein [unclassified Streptomyces]|uniref:DUF1775 domain-containing protein n=1 Tax=unclassified Streptomyces TaxID=2593676 RepID=UPI00039D1F1E|nr:MULTISPECIES: DUF1775 domain-containing protein [unclassified Streptomyces]MYX38947.1 DUF1775 domain-containing protein [Streptomyces sp. SID8377]